MSNTTSRVVVWSLLVAVMAAGMGDALAQSRGGKDKAQDRGAGHDQARREHRSREPANQPTSRPIASDKSDERASDPRRHGRQSSQRELSDAVRRVERRTGGQVLSAEQVPYEGRSLSRVKVVDSSGRVRIYMDDPNIDPPDRSKPPRAGRGRSRGDDN